MDEEEIERYYEEMEKDSQIGRDLMMALKVRGETE